MSIDRGVQVDRNQQVTHGAGVKRKVIFAAPVNQPDFALTMVRNIDVAKSLGATIFEIETRAGKAPKPKQEASMYALYFGVSPVDQEGEEWKRAPNSDREFVDCEIVTVYALVIE